MNDTTHLIDNLTLRSEIIDLFSELERTKAQLQEAILLLRKTPPTRTPYNDAYYCGHCYLPVEMLDGSAVVARMRHTADCPLASLLARMGDQ